MRRRNLATPLDHPPRNIIPQIHREIQQPFLQLFLQLRISCLQLPQRPVVGPDRSPPSQLSQLLLPLRQLLLKLACTRLRAACALRVFEFALELEHELLQLLDLHAALLDLDLEVDILLERGVDLVGGELREALLEEVYLELDVEVLLLERIDVLHCVQCSEQMMTRFRYIVEVYYHYRNKWTTGIGAYLLLVAQSEVRSTLRPRTSRTFRASRRRYVGRRVSPSF